MSNSRKPTTNPLASSTFYVLMALSDMPRYGLSIAEEVERYTQGAVQLGPGTLYNTIKKMLSAGLLEEAPLDDADDPRRRYYRITRAGREALDQEARRLADLVAALRTKRLVPEQGR